MRVSGERVRGCACGWFIDVKGSSLRVFLERVESDRGRGLTIVGELTLVVTVLVVPKKQEHALDTLDAGNEATPVGKRSSSSVRPPGYTVLVTVAVLVVILFSESQIIPNECSCARSGLFFFLFPFLMKRKRNINK